jgi:4-hydroxybenzoyl-CoA thioesterase
MKPLVHRRNIRIEWGDCDPAQIVFYPRYFAMFDGGTQELFRAALGMPKIQWVKRYGIVGIPLVDARARFMVPSWYGDDIVLESQVTEWRRSSFSLTHRILKDGALALEGAETRVWAGADPDKPGGLKGYPIPDAVKALFVTAGD